MSLTVLASFAALSWLAAAFFRVRRTPAPATKVWPPAPSEAARPDLRTALDRLTYARLASGPVLLLVVGLTPVGAAAVRAVSPGSRDLSGVFLGGVVALFLLARLLLLNRLGRPMRVGEPAAVRSLRRRVALVAGIVAAGAVYGAIYADSTQPSYEFGLYEAPSPGPTVGGNGITIDGSALLIAVLVLVASFALSPRLLLRPAKEADSELAGCCAYVAGRFGRATPRVVLTSRQAVRVAAAVPGFRSVIGFGVASRARLPNGEMTWIMAHEMAHIAHRHAPARIVSGLARAAVGVSLAAYASTSSSLMSLAGVHPDAVLPLLGLTDPGLQPLPLEVAAFTLWMLLTRPVELALSRREEALADREAERIVPGYGPPTMDLLMLLAPQPSPTYRRDRLLWLSHPPTAERRARLTVP